jgi:hypothetical protein
MKRRLIPKDYTYGIQNTIGGLLFILGTFIFLAVVNIFGEPIEITEWLKAAGPISTFGLIMVIFDQVKYRKVKEQRRQRERMMTNQHTFYIDIYGNLIAFVITIIAIIAVIAIFMLR